MASSLGTKLTAVINRSSKASIATERGPIPADSAITSALMGKMSGVQTWRWTTTGMASSLGTKLTAVINRSSKANIDKARR
jgi:hypothetical protein